MKKVRPSYGLIRPYKVSVTATATATAKAKATSTATETAASAVTSTVTATICSQDFLRLLGAFSLDAWTKTATSTEKDIAIAVADSATD